MNNNILIMDNVFNNFDKVHPDPNYKVMFKYKKQIFS
jgi:hypothetical protein